MELPRHSLEIEALDLGTDVKAVGLELIETMSREPLRGTEAAKIWSTALPAIAGREPWALDFFSHVDRVHEFCRLHAIAFRDAAERCCVVTQPEPERLAELFERFEGETFGIRAGDPLFAGDTALEADLARRGVDAYHPAFPRYYFCAVCDFENGFLTLLSNRLWASEIIRRVRPVMEGLQVSVARPQ
ncbi:MAG TPA: hypothetical protein VEU31_06515 [Candidatus Acidoferrales bacterium]|nr:hypothetical protein [Candidatus Acidoferrales bacterium]